MEILGAAAKSGRPQGPQRAEESQRLECEPDIIHVRLSPLIYCQHTTGAHPVKPFSNFVESDEPWLQSYATSLIQRILHAIWR
jgi:hypothetical protein